MKNALKRLAYHISRFDLFLFRHIFGWNGRKKIDRFFYLLSRSGDGYLYGAVGAYLLFLRDMTGLKALLASLSAFSLELPVSVLIKKWARRIRPFESVEGILHLIKPPDKYSFPSGHAAAAFLIADILSFQFPPIQVPLYSWASLVGFSRIYLGVHFPSDVVAGMILGLSASHFGIWLVT
ncbi:phosphatase PAP2 family protein [candidate division KSB1 bacterium]|nr:phosphatase PAP2 family protein [candidate division KSB1 bacterium]